MENNKRTYIYTIGRMARCGKPASHKIIAHDVQELMETMFKTFGSSYANYEILCIKEVGGEVLYLA